MKKIIILRGNSGSGKTTVARALQKKFGFLNHIRDWIRKQDEYKELQNVLASSCKKKDLELIEQVHKSDFV